MKILKIGFFATALFVSSIQATFSGPYKTLPDTISLPNGFHPEGIAKGYAHYAYAGSLLDGSIYEVNLKNGEGNLLVDSEEGAAVGLAYDHRTNYLYAAGGLNGTVTVYDAADGELKSVFDVAPPGAFINDGIVAKDAAYFTDSFAPVIYRIPLQENGRLPDNTDIETIPLSEEFAFIPGEFNGNGIVMCKKTGKLILINATTGLLYHVDPDTGEATAFELDSGPLYSGDGLVLDGHTLYVAQAFFNQVVELKLNVAYNKAKTIRVLTNDDFHIPSTIALFGKNLFAVNAKFDIAPPPFFVPPANLEQEFEIVRTSLK